MYHENTDELVAYGAAVQGAVLGGANQVKNFIVKDVYPFTLWAETPDKKVERILHCNSLIPAGKIHIFSTASINPSNMVMQVYEGNETFSKDDNRLGTFRLHGLTTGPNILNKQPQIKVTFTIDTNSILTVWVEKKETEYEKYESSISFIMKLLGMAENETTQNNKGGSSSLFDIIMKLFRWSKEKTTKNNKGASFYDILMESIVGVPNGLDTKIKPAENIDCRKLSSEEIKKMVKDAEKFAANDKKVKEIMNAQNELENFAYMIKHLISDKGKFSSILSKEDKTVINEEANNMIIWTKSKYDLNDLKTKRFILEQMMREIIKNTLFQEHLYSKSKDRKEL